MSGRITWLVIAVGLIVVVVGVALAGSLGADPSVVGSALINKPAPEITLEELGGDGQVQLADHLGDVVVVNFWASWCKPCEQEAEDLQTAWELYEGRGDVIFLGVDYVDTEPEALKYMEKFSITYPSGPDLGTRISQAFRISGVPETYVIDKEGKIALRQIGPFVSLSQITNAIDPLLDK